MHRKKLKKISPFLILHTGINVICLLILLIVIVPLIEWDYKISFLDLFSLLFTSLLTIFLANYVVKTVEWNSSNRRSDNEIVINMLKDILPLCNDFKKCIEAQNPEYSSITALCKDISTNAQSVKELLYGIKGEECPSHDRLMQLIRKTRNDATSISNNTSNLSHLAVRDGRIYSIGTNKKQQILKDIENIKIQTYKYWSEVNKM